MERGDLAVPFRGWMGVDDKSDNGRQFNQFSQLKGVTSKVTCLVPAYAPGNFHPVVVSPLSLGLYAQCQGPFLDLSR